MPRRRRCESASTRACSGSLWMSKSKDESAAIKAASVITRQGSLINPCARSCRTSSACSSHCIAGWSRIAFVQHADPRVGDRNVRRTQFQGYPRRYLKLSFCAVWHATLILTTKARRKATAVQQTAPTMWFGSRLVISIRLPHFASEHAGSLSVVRKGLRLRVPLERPAETNGDHPEVTH